MPRTPGFPARELTRHHALAPKFLGYTAMGWLKFYGLLAGLYYAVGASFVRYGQIFDGYREKDAFDQFIIVLWTLPPLLFALPVVLLFFWWLAGALVRYTRWQAAQAVLWRSFWMFILLFYGYVLFDPLDSIHPLMARKGLAPAPDFVAMIGDGQFFPPPLFQFQWGYFLLWGLFWFLVVTANWSYITDGLREVWFHLKRLRRYGVSVLLGFRETARLAHSAPVTRDYPRERPALPPVYRGVPRLNVERLTVQEAAAIRAADSSGAMSSPPGQPEVLFVDLGVYDYSPLLAELKRADGTPLLRFTDYWAPPETQREELVIPLGGSLPVGTRFTASADPVGTGLALSAQSEDSEAEMAAPRRGLSGSGSGNLADGASPVPTGGEA